MYSCPYKFAVRIYLVVMLCLPCFGTELSSSAKSAVLDFLQHESAAVTASNNEIRNFLVSNQIPIGGTPGSLRDSGKSVNRKVKIALSTQESDFECRVTLGKPPLGRKLIAPCGCTGSQEWVQFAELNRLRRKEPSQWVICQTCLQKYDYGPIHENGGVLGNVLSHILDNTKILRTAAVVVASAIVFILPVNKGIMRIVTSGALWQSYPKWSKVVHLPLVLKFFFGKMAATKLYEMYIKGENKLVDYLTEMETTLIESNLKVTEI